MTVPANARLFTLHLTDSEQAAKTRAVGAYQTQVRVMGSFLRAFETADEHFIQGDGESWPPCWCSGENITAAPASSR
jgi:hypothetical protein